MTVLVETEFSRKNKNLTEAGQDVSEFEAPEISPEEFADHMANLVATALSSTKMFGVVEVRAGIGQVHVMGRVKRERERQFVDKVVMPVLTVMESSDDCNGFVGKQFILKDGSVKYAWVISFASNDLRRAAAEICRAFEEVIPRVEVTESPLMGPSTPQSGGRSSGKKGASPISG
jgi:hypothetical protein